MEGFVPFLYRRSSSNDVGGIHWTREVEKTTAFAMIRMEKWKKVEKDRNFARNNTTPGCGIRAKRRIKKNEKKTCVCMQTHTQTCIHQHILVERYPQCNDFESSHHASLE